MRMQLKDQKLDSESRCSMVYRELPALGGLEGSSEPIVHTLVDPTASRVQETVRRAGKTAREINFGWFYLAGWVIGGGATTGLITLVATADQTPSSTLAALLMGLAVLAALAIGVCTVLPIIAAWFSVLVDELQQRRINRAKQAVQAYARAGQHVVNVDNDLLVMWHDTLERHGVGRSHQLAKLEQHFELFRDLQRLRAQQQGKLTDKALRQRTEAVINAQLDQAAQVVAAQVEYIKMATRPRPGLSAATDQRYQHNAHLELLLEAVERTGAH